MPEKHTILEGKVNLYRRNDSPIWQCSTYLPGRNWRISTKEESLARAKDWAEDWYFGLKDKGRRGELLGEKTFKDAADQFIAEYEVLTEGERNARWVQDHYRRIRTYLTPLAKRVFRRSTAARCRRTVSTGSRPQRARSFLCCRFRWLPKGSQRRPGVQNRD